MQPYRLGLNGYVPSRIEAVPKELVIGLLEERCSGSVGVRAIGDDGIVGRGVLREEFEAVADVDCYAWVGEEGGHVRKVLLGYTDDCLYI